MRHLIGLNFHGIGSPERELEEGEAPYWVTEQTFLHILDRVAENPDRYVLTFDDGNRSDHSIGLPALCERNLKAIFFVLTGRLGLVGSLGEAHIHELMAHGMTIGSHGVDHLPWPTLSQSDLETELVSSRNELERVCGVPVTFAGVPFGRYDANVLRALRRAGYDAAYTSDGGVMQSQAFVRARTSFRGDMDSAEIDRILNGALPLRRRLRRRIGMLKRRVL